MSQNSQTIVRRLAPGIYELESGGFRVKVSVGDWKRGGLQRHTTYPKGTALRKMKDWQTNTRAVLKRQQLVPATGTLEADIPRYLDTLAHKPRLASDRKYQLEAWVAHFGTRRRHMITRPEVQQQVTSWERGGVAASTIRHRMTALSQLYRELDGENGSNPVKGVKRPSEPVLPGAPIFFDFLANRRSSSPAGSVRSRQNPSKFAWVHAWVVACCSGQACLT